MYKRQPLGGYVKFLGDAGAASNPDQEALDEIKSKFENNEDVQLEDIFHFKPLWQRALVVLAGPMFNFILAVFIFAGLGLALGSYTIESLVGEVMDGSAAEEAGILPGDRILMMDGKDVSLFTDLSRYVVLKSNSTIDTVLDRNGERITLALTPQRVEERDFVGGKSSTGRIGIRSSSDANVVQIKYNPLTAIGYGVNEVSDTIGMTATYIGRIFAGKEDGKQLGSVVKIATLTGKTAVDAARSEVGLGERLKLLTIRLLSIAASLSIALGFANLMPIPVLDGGHLLYYGYEAIAGRPLSQKKQEFGFRLGFALLLTLFVILTVNDIGYVASMFS